MPRRSTGFWAVTASPRRGAPEPPRTRRWASRRSAASLSATRRDVRPRPCRPRPARVAIGMAAWFGVDVAVRGGQRAGSRLRQGPATPGASGEPAKADEAGLLGTPCWRIPVEPGRSRWNRKRTRSSVVRWVTARGADDPGPGGHPGADGRGRGRCRGHSGPTASTVGSVRASTAWSRGAGRSRCNTSGSAETGREGSRSPTGRDGGQRPASRRFDGGVTEAPRARRASTVNSAISPWSPRAARAASASRAASSGWMASWAYLVRDVRSRSAADSHSRCSDLLLVARPRSKVSWSASLRPTFRMRPSTSASTTLSASSGTGTRHPGRVPDGLELADEHVEDDTRRRISERRTLRSRGARSRR